MSPQSQTCLTLMVLVDALRPDYLTHAPFLSSLAADSATGVFREGFGFVPRQAYFGGLSTSEYGFTNMFCFDPAASPFKAAWNVGEGKATSVEEEPQGGRAFVERRARGGMAPFAQSYFSSYQIPLAYLPYFDLVEKRAPWEPNVGYRSLFAILDEQGIPWCQQMWPDTNRLADNSDAGIVRQVLAEVQPHHRLACVHLQELDGTGHAHGPNSAALQKAVARTDGLCREMIGGLKQRFGRVNVVLFGDHGMVSVTRSLDLAPVLEATGLRFGTDYAYFLDSSMARFWFYHRQARTKVEAALDLVAGGHVLRGVELALHGLDRCDPRNGELYFLADPGVLIFPNFFQQSGHPIPGMHGYDPDCPDNYGYFLWHDSSRPELAGQRLGKVDPHLLFPVLLRSVGLEPQEFTAHAEPLPAASPPVRRYTRHPDAGAEATVAAQLEAIKVAIHQRVGPVEAIILTGSFGRGEGGVFRDGKGRYRPVNDYDILVADGRDLHKELAGLGNELARRLEIDYVDLNPIDGRWEQLPLTIFTYDLRYGSQVIAGDARLLERIPAFASADIPVFEVIRLLLNRTSGLLSGMEVKSGQPALGAEPQRYLTNQVAKAWMALGDAYLVQWRGYDTSYARRRERFAALAPGAGVSAPVIGAVCQAYDFKCLPDYGCFARGYADVADFRMALEPALRQTVAAMVKRPQGSVDEAMAAFLRHMSANPADLKVDNDYVHPLPALAGLVKPESAATLSLRHGICAGLPLVLRAIFEPDTLSAARDILAPLLHLPAPTAARDHDCEALRAVLVKAWFAACH